MFWDLLQNTPRKLLYKGIITKRSQFDRAVSALPSKLRGIINEQVTIDGLDKHAPNMALAVAVIRSQPVWAQVPEEIFFQTLASVIAGNTSYSDLLALVGVDEATIAATHIRNNTPPIKEKGKKIEPSSGDVVIAETEPPEQIPETLRVLWQIPQTRLKQLKGYGLEEIDEWVARLITSSDAFRGKFVRRKGHDFFYQTAVVLLALAIKNGKGQSFDPEGWQTYEDLETALWECRSAILKSEKVNNLYDLLLEERLKLTESFENPSL